MPVATLVGEPNEGERQQWVDSGLAELEHHANSSVERITEVGAGIVSLYQRGASRRVGGMATGFIVPQRSTPVPLPGGGFGFRN